MLLTQQVAKDKNLNTNEMSEKGLDLRLNITNNQCSKCKPSAKHWLAATRIRVSFEGSLLNYVNISGKIHHHRNQDVSQSVNYTTNSVMWEIARPHSMTKLRRIQYKRKIYILLRGRE